MPRVLQSAVNTLLTQTTIEDGLHYGYVFIQVFSGLTCPLNALRKYSTGINFDRYFQSGVQRYVSTPFSESYRENRINSLLQPTWMVS